MRSKNIVPIGQGCHPYRVKLRGTLKQEPCRCQQHPSLYLNVCLGCGEKFHSERSHTITCSDRCRQRKSRSKRFDKTFQMVMRFAEFGST